MTVNNYYLIRRVALWLGEYAKGFYIREIYSLSKQEMCVVMAYKNKFISLRLYCGNETSFLFFPEMSNAPRHAKNIFEEAVNTEVLEVIMPENERYFLLELSNGFTLLFKLFGKNANVILYTNKVLKSVFREQIKADLNEPYPEVTEQHHATLQEYIRIKKNYGADTAISTCYPSLRNELKEYFIINNTAKTDEEEWNYLQKIHQDFLNPSYYFYHKNAKVFLSFIKPENEKFAKYTNTAEALNEFARNYFQYKKYHETKKILLAEQTKVLHKIRSRIDSAHTQMQKIKTHKDYREKADLIMANLAAIKAGEKEIYLNDFNTGLPIKIKLKGGLTPLQCAERFYEKAKSQNKQREMVNQLLLRLNTEFERGQIRLNKISEAENMKDLKPFISSHHKSAQNNSDEESNFRKYSYMGYEILAGKNARNNDELTFKYSTKTDLWLHVFGASGSHVIIRNPKKQNIPEAVLEEAAAIAAAYSKLQHSSFVPVVYTERKFVRKPRGSEPGEVAVEREKTLVVAPKKL